MNKAQLIQDLSNLVGPAGKGMEVQPPALTVWLNDAIEMCYSAINDTIPDYFTKLATADSVEDQNEYELPDDFEKAVLVSISYDGTNYVRAFPLNTIGGAVDIQQTNSTNFDISSPYYYIVRNRIGFQPTFSSTVTNGLKVWYTFSPATLENDQDEPDLPRRFQSILKFWAYANYLDQNDEHAAAEKMRQRFDAQLERLVAQLSEQQVDTPRTVDVTSDDFGLYGRVNG